MKADSMRTLGALALGALILALAAAAGAADEGVVKPPKGFTALFNGKDLSGWWGETTTDPKTYLNLPPAELSALKEKSLPDIQAHWRAENGELVNDGKGKYATTDKWYRNFELLIDYKTVPLADSGVYLRGCPQVQIWDSTQQEKFNRGADRGSGALWNNTPGKPGKNPLVLADKPFGEWNSFRIVMAGDRVWVWLNGKQTVDGAVMENYYDKTRTTPVPEQGPIQLQTHGGEIRWRNIFIRELGDDETKAWLAKPLPQPTTDDLKDAAAALKVSGQKSTIKEPAPAAKKARAAKKGAGKKGAPKAKKKA